MDSGCGVRDFALASGIVQAAAEAGEGGQAEAGSDDALDDCRTVPEGRWESQSSATASAIRRSLMMASSRANLRLRTSMRRRSSERVMGLPREGVCMDEQDGRDGGSDWGRWGIFLKTRSYPLISGHLSRDGR